MAHRFDVIVNGKLKSYTRFEDIPDNIERVILFEPEIPPEPHTHEQHEEIDSWNSKFLALMERKCLLEQVLQQLNAYHTVAQ